MSFAVAGEVGFGLPWLMLQNFTDGVFYLGYAMHFRELLDRVGLTYYAVRFSGIAPDALAFSLLGSEVGFVAPRYALAGACCVALFVLFSRRYGMAAGWFAAFAWAFNLAAIRLLQIAYVDVVGAAFLCLGLCLLCLLCLPRAAGRGPRAGVCSAFFGGLFAGDDILVAPARGRGACFTLQQTHAWQLLEIGRSAAPHHGRAAFQGFAAIWS